MKEDTLSQPQQWVEEVFGPGIGLRFPVKSLLFSGQSPYQKVEIYDTSTHGRVLLNDGCFMTSDRDEFIYHEMIAHVPILSHPNPKSVLIIGGGDGGTAREVLAHSCIESCVMVEIDSMVVEASREFLPQTARSLSDPRLDLRIEDGVKFVAECQDQFDIILVDSTDPVGPAQPLFGKDFYRHIKRLLGEKGIVIAQGESPFYSCEMQSKLLSIMGEFFKIVRPYNFVNTIYPGGLWSFMFASDTCSPDAPGLEDRLARADLKLDYYTAAIHRSAFALPKFMTKGLGPLIKG